MSRAAAELPQSCRRPECHSGKRRNKIAISVLCCGDEAAILWVGLQGREVEFYQPGFRLFSDLTDGTVVPCHTAEIQ